MVIPIRSVAGVIGSFAPRWNLPWQAAPTGATRLTASQARNASGLLSSYYARSLAEQAPAGILHKEIADREAARIAALRHSLTHEGMAETLNSRVKDQRKRIYYSAFHESAIHARTAGEDLERVSSKKYLNQEKKTFKDAAKQSYNEEKKNHEKLSKATRSQLTNLKKKERSALKKERTSIHKNFASKRKEIDEGIKARKDKLNSFYRNEIESRNQGITNKQNASILRASETRKQKLAALDESKARMLDAQRVRREANKQYAKEVAAAKATATATRRSGLEKAALKRDTRLSIIDSSDTIDDKRKKELKRKVRDEYNKEAQKVRDNTSAAKKGAMTSAVATRNQKLSSVKGVEKFDPKKYSALRSQINEEYKKELTAAKTSASNARKNVTSDVIARKKSVMTEIEKQATEQKKATSAAEKAAIANAAARSQSNIKKSSEAAEKKIASSLKKVNEKKGAIKESVRFAEKKVADDIKHAETALSAARAQREMATSYMRAETVRRRGAAPRRRTIYDPWLALNSPNERMSTRLVGQRGWRSTNFLRAGMTTDYSRNAQYLRERMRMLRLAGFHDLTRNQALMRSAELIRTRGLITANNRALGRARWGNFFRPFTDAMRKATHAVGEFSMRLFGSISRIGLHPLRGMRSMLGWAGSSLFAGLAPGGGIMKGIGAMFSATFKAIRAMGMPVLRGMFNLMVRIATAPLTWVAGLTAATLATGNLKNVLAGVYIGISAIGVGISKIYEQAKKVFSWIAERFVENMKQANAIIDPVLNLWKTSFVRIGSDVKSAFGTITRSIGAGRWGDAFKMLGATWRVIRAELSAVLKANWEHMKLTFMTSWNRVVDYFQNGEGLLGIIKWALTGLWGIAKWAIAGLYNVGTMLVGKALKIGQRIMLGDTAVYTSNRWSERSLKANIIDSMRELKSRKINIDLSKYKNIQEYYNYVHHMSRADAINAVAYRKNGERRVFDTKAMNDEWEVFLQEALAAVQGKPFTDPTDNMGGLGYSSAEIEDQQARVAAVSNAAGNMDVSKDPGVIAAREALKETQMEMEGNVERQRAAEAEAALKEREEGVLKELGEGGVGRVTKAMEGFYDFSKVSENRRREMIAAAGEYITKMGMSIDQFEKIIQTLISMFGAGKGNAGWFSESSNVERYANIANPVIAKAMQLLGGSAFSGGFSFSYEDRNGDRINKTLARTRDGKELTQFEQLQELAQVLNTLSPEQAQDVRRQFVEKYGAEAVDTIEKALNVINKRSDGIDFTEEKNMYARNVDAETAFGKLSQYEQENLGAALRLARLDDTDEMKEAVAGGVFGSAESKAVLPIIKTGSYRGAFGNTIDTLQTYQPEDQKDFSTATRNAATMFGIVNKMNTTELDKKMRFYGINADEMTNMEKLQALKGKEGASGVQSVLMKAIKYQLASRKDLSDEEKKSGLKQLDRFTGKFAEWIKAPERAAEKPMLYSVVQANLRGMLDTFKAFAENRNRVILDRRAKAEKDAKAAEEEKKKKEDEKRLENIESHLEDLSDCVANKKLNINAGVA